MLLKIFILLLWGAIFLAPGLYLFLKKERYKSGILWILLGVLIGAGFNKYIYEHTEMLWFREVGYEGRFWISFYTVLKLFFAGAVASMLLAAINLGIMHFGEKRDRTHYSIEFALKKLAQAGNFTWIKGFPDNVVIQRNHLYSGAFIGFFIISLIFGFLLSNQPQSYLLYRNGISFGFPDPLFKNDVGFYVFSLPFLIYLSRYVGALLVVVVLAISGLYFLQHRYAQDKNSRDAIVRRGVSHISALGILLIADIIFATRIGLWQLLFSTRGAVFGAGWTDIHVQAGAYRACIISLVVAIVILIFIAANRTLRVTTKAAMAITGFVLCAATFVIGAVLVPALIQWVWVAPNELTREKEYIKHNIAFTQFAYGLTKDKIDPMNFPVVGTADKNVLHTDRQALESVGLLGSNVYQSISNQNEACRLYYFFRDVDVVRYRLDGKLALLLSSARELDSERLAESSRTWQNTRLVYTHGFGAVASPSSKFTREGLPDYYLNGIPPKSRYPELEIKEPRIYFGRQTTNTIFVNTAMKEFDYPRGDGNAEYSYTGKGGIVLDSLWKKLLFAFRGEGFRLLTSSEITEKSRIMIRRDLQTRLKTIVPFLAFDKNIYQVIVGGKLYYLCDAYTTTDTYPYSEPYKNGSHYLSSLHWDVHDIDSFNYIRNSVKVVVDAFDGTVQFYRFDESDPILKTYDKIFPAVFKPASEMPEGLRAHIRYPQGLLQVQAALYANYHMEDPGVFYNKEDAWEVSKSSIRKNEVVPFPPYYTMMKVPGSAQDEFVLLLPFSPLSTDPQNARNNMVSVLLARCDGEHYGKLTLLKFPKDKLVYGPLQISIRINQDDIISKDLTLWNQQGSNALFGTLYIIPLSGYRMLYVQPIYLQAEIGKMPELKRVIVASGDAMSYGDSFDDALEKLLNNQSANAEHNGKKDMRPIKDMLHSLGKYRKLIGEGRYAEAGKIMESVENSLKTYYQTI